MLSRAGRKPKQAKRQIRRRLEHIVRPPSLRLMIITLRNIAGLLICDGQGIRFPFPILAGEYKNCGLSRANLNCLGFCRNHSDFYFFTYQARPERVIRSVVNYCLSALKESMIAYSNRKLNRLRYPGHVLRKAGFKLHS